MVDTLVRTRPAVRTMVITYGPPSTRLGAELRAIAEDLTGRIDRDELSCADEALVVDAIDAAVDAVMPEVLELLDRELGPRLASLPPATRLTLARARRRLEFGID